MFLFRDKAAPPAAAAPASGADAVQGGREFLAVKAARWLGGAARQAGASIKRLAAGPSAEGLRKDLETRASGAPESLELAITEWGKLLAATDETPRYESSQGPVTFRSAFLASRAYELCLGTAASGIGSGRSCTSKASLSACPAWQAFAKEVALPGSEELVLKLPAVLAETRYFSDCRRWAEEVALSLKADAYSEHLRGQRTAAAKRAEELRAGLREKRRRNEGGSGAAAVSSSAEEECSTSTEAVQNYLAFRTGLDEASARLKKVWEERRSKLEAAQKALADIEADAGSLAAASHERREAVLHEREAALDAPRKAVEELEKDTRPDETEKEVRELEEQRRQLLLELEGASQELAKERDARMELLRRRESSALEHRQRAEVLEKELADLRPAQFYKVLPHRAAAMTEGEILTGLRQATDKCRSLAERFQSAGREAHRLQAGDLLRQREVLGNQLRSSLEVHAGLELQRLEATGSTVGSCVATLLDVARARSDLLARGLSPEVEDLYSMAAIPRRQDMQQLRAALTSAEAAWQEAVDLWDCKEETAFSALKAEQAEAALRQLEDCRGRIAQCLADLQRADPALYELAFLQGGEDLDGDLVAGHELPHGWEAHATEEEGLLYYHSLVTGETQWDLPTQDAAVTAGWRLFQADDGGWFYHNPYNGQGVWWPELPDYAAEPDSLDSLRRDAAAHG